MPLPDLTFPSMKYGRQQIPHNLRCLLFPSSGADTTRLVTVAPEIFSASFQKRVDLVVGLHEQLNGELVAGGSKYTLRNKILALRRFFSWADKEGLTLDSSTVIINFKYWTDHLLEWHRSKQATISTVYRLAKNVSTMLTQLFERRQPLIIETRLRGQGEGDKSGNHNKDRQNLEDTFVFGHLLLDICTALTEETVFGPLPIRIPLRDGRIYEDWLHLMSPEKLKTPKHENDKIRTAQRREKFEADTSIKRRHPMIHLRLEAELLIFISQTGMNFSQAYRLKHDRFHYTSYLDGYQVRRYKERRGGEVQFSIYGEYKKIFENYLQWRARIFPNMEDGLLFPFINIKGRADDEAPRLHQTRKICHKRNVDFVGPRALRNTRVNWILRRSQDPGLSAEMAQHTKETLLRTYERPNLQVAMIEITKFHCKADPTISSPGPGECVAASPLALTNTPANATLPDCSTPAGCLFCVQQRDIDSEDHVWSLATFRHLKSIELMKSPLNATTSGAVTKGEPSEAAIERITAKLGFYESSSEVRRLWVSEALARVTEGDYHPMWDGFIQIQES